VLVTAWEDGAGLRHVAETWSEGERKAAGRALLEHAFGFFRHGFVHADLHPGNFRFRKTTDGGVALVLYDFGCIFRGEPEHRLALLRLIGMTEANADDDPYPLFLKLGFDPAYLEPIADRLPGLCRVLFEPFILASPYHVSRWHLGERVAGVLGEDRWNFRIAGPPSLILLMRMFHGLIHALATLDVELPWRFLLEPIRQQFSQAVDALALAEPPQPARGFGNVAKHLRIHVKREGQTRVQLTSPMQMIDQLDATLDVELRGQIAAQGIDLHEIVARVRASGYRPQEVFRLTTAEKDIRVWLE
jgi:predicted unusual protein kinase regulating ubiquinone biosynthesis (AarF/ABC1/UbiB family)